MVSLTKKLRSLIKHGLSGVSEGMYYFKNENPEVEKLARDRAERATCLVDEPIEFLRVQDKRIPALSNKMCDHCGCTAAYKFRVIENFCDKCET